MNPADSADNDLLTLPSPQGAFQKTIERLKSLLARKGIDIFAHVDHTFRRCRPSGLPLRATSADSRQPAGGHAAHAAAEAIVLDLPLRILVWEDEARKVWLTYRRVQELTPEPSSDWPR